MTGKLRCLTLVSVSFSAVAQISLKAGVSTPNFAVGIASGKREAMLVSAVMNLYVVGGVGLYFLGAVMWLLVLSKVDVPIAYFFGGLGFLLTTAFAWLFSRENGSLIRVLGTALVAVGVCLVARS